MCLTEKKVLEAGLSAGDVLIFVEDPGAANFVADLPAALSPMYRAVLLSAGAASTYWRQQGVESFEVRGAPTAATVLARVEPRILVVGTSENPDTLGLALVHEARLAGIPSVGVIDIEANAAYRFRGRGDTPLAFAPDWLMVADESTAKSYEGLGFPAARLRICGHPHHDHVRAVARQLRSRDRSALRRSLFPGARRDQHVVVFVSEISESLDPDHANWFCEYSLKGRGTSTSRTSVVIEEFLDAFAELERRPYRVLRLHPKNQPEEFTQYLHEFDHVSRGGSPLELVYASDLVVGMTSFLMAEAVLIGCNVLSAIPRATERAWLPDFARSSIPCVSTRDQLRAALAASLRHHATSPPPRRDDPRAGSALERVAAALEAVLKASPCRTVAAP